MLGIWTRKEQAEEGHSTSLLREAVLTAGLISCHLSVSKSRWECDWCWSCLSPVNDVMYKYENKTRRFSTLVLIIKFHRDRHWTLRGEFLSNQNSKHVLGYSRASRASGSQLGQRIWPSSITFYTCRTVSENHHRKLTFTVSKLACSRITIRRFSFFLATAILTIRVWRVISSC